MTFPIRAFPFWPASDYPAITDVRAGVAYDTALTGTLDLPAVADVKVGISFDNGTQTGTYDPGGGSTTVLGWHQGAGWN